MRKRTFEHKKVAKPHRLDDIQYFTKTPHHYAPASPLAKLIGSGWGGTLQTATAGQPRGGSPAATCW